jgi:hypothetical protein
LRKFPEKPGNKNTKREIRKGERGKGNREQGKGYCLL